MKKLSVTMIAVAAMFFSVQATNAQTTGEEATETVEQAAPAQEEWTKITAEELPTEVQAAIERDLADMTVSETYVGEMGGAKAYKLLVTTADGKTGNLYADETGKWIQP